MKTIITSSKFWVLLITALLVLFCSYSILAQDKTDKKTKKVQLKTVFYKNGKTITKDTTFESGTIYYDKSNENSFIMYSDDFDSKDTIRPKSDELVFEKDNKSDDFISKNENVLDSVMKGKSYKLDKEGNKVYHFKGDNDKDVFIKKLKESNKYSFNIPSTSQWKDNEFHIYMDDKKFKIEIDSIMKYNKKKHRESFIIKDFDTILNSNRVKIIINGKNMIFQKDSCKKRYEIFIDSLNPNQLIFPEFPDLPELPDLPDFYDFREFHTFPEIEMHADDFNDDFDENDNNVKIYRNGDTLITKRILKSKKENDSTCNHHKSIYIKKHSKKDKKLKETYLKHSYEIQIKKSDKNDKKVIAKITIEDIKDADKKKLKSKGIENDLAKKESDLQFESIIIGPNPNSGKFNLNFKIKNTKDVLIKIYDANMKQVYNEVVKNFTGSYSNEIDLSANGKGTFFLHFVQGNRSMIKKMIIQ